MLIISHFHKDHINYIKQLLQNTNGAKKVYLPYLMPEEKILCYIDSFESDGFNNDIFDFLKDPQGYLQQLNVDEIIYIHSSEEKDENIVPKSNTGSVDEPNYEFDLIDTLKSPSLDEFTDTNNVKHRIDVGGIELIDLWIFKFFNKVRNINHVNSFIQSLKSLMGTTAEPTIDEISRFVRNNEISIIKDLKELYINHFPKSHINDTSLLLFHGPL